MRGINFKEAILFTHDPPADCRGIRVVKINKLNWHEYNDCCLSIGRAVDADYVLFIQDDGFVLNPSLWDPRFLEYDYIGAPWPSDPSWVDQQTAKAELQRVLPHNRVGNGGFSLRSRRFMELSDRFTSCGLYGEDCYLCTIHYDYMIKNGVKYAPLDLAYRFAIENPISEYGGNWENPGKMDPSAHFGFHGRQYENSSWVIGIKDQLTIIG